MSRLAQTQVSYEDYAAADYSAMVPPHRSPFMRIRMSSSSHSKATPPRKSSSNALDNRVTFFSTNGFHSATTMTSFAKTSESNRKAVSSGFKIVESNPYPDMLRESIDVCKKCKGDGIYTPMHCDEPMLCPKCKGHGYANDAMVIAPKGSCGGCLIM